MSHPPDWNLHAILPSPVESKNDARGKVGAGWNNEDGSISIVLNLAVVLDERSIVSLRLFPNTPRTSRATEEF